MVTSRPKLYDLLRKKIPDHRIQMGKKVLRTVETKGRVAVYCSDNTIYDCKIVVGADGAYSAVRQNMYKQLDKEGKLPLRDKEDFSIGHITMVGVAIPPNPEVYPELKDDRVHFRLMVGDHNESLYVVSTPNNQLCWGLTTQIPLSKAKELQFRNSEWGPESVENMLKEYQDLPCTFGGTMKDLFDATPKHLFLPGAGQGAVMAMKDAVILANCLYNMEDYSAENVTGAFNSYYKQRYADAKAQFKDSVFMSKIMFGQKWLDRLLRHLVINYIPDWLMQKKHNEGLAYRPQINWLPLAEIRGVAVLLPQVGRSEATLKASRTT
ncbi:hypothetical protein BGX27_002390 [Mortierella sp. AM989]|nr:hypothetical protein BGX27_002390 [Mortierella sp. AM989]